MLARGFAGGILGEGAEADVDVFVGGGGAGVAVVVDGGVFEAEAATVSAIVEGGACASVVTRGADDVRGAWGELGEG